MQTPTTSDLLQNTEGAGGDGSTAIQPRERDRPTVARIARLVDDHPFATLGAAIFSGAMVGRLTRGAREPGPIRAMDEDSDSSTAFGMVSTVARAAIKAAAVSMITRRLVRTFSDDESHRPGY